MLRAARRILDVGRQLRRDARAGVRVLTSAETRLTMLTAASVRVFEEILTLARLNEGRVYPSYDRLAQVTGLGRATVARALRILENIGFLMRQRRFKRIEDAQGPGPRYEQTSNAYRIFLPAFLREYLPRSLRPAPLPEDAVHRMEEHAQDMQDMVRSLSCRELAETHIGGSLGKVLARLGAALDRQFETEAGSCKQRESQKHPQPLLHFNKTKLDRVGLDGQHAFSS